MSETSPTTDSKFYNIYKLRRHKLGYVHRGDFAKFLYVSAATVYDAENGVEWAYDLIVKRLHGRGIIDSLDYLEHGPMQFVPGMGRGAGAIVHSSAPPKARPDPGDAEKPGYIDGKRYRMQSRSLARALKDIEAILDSASLPYEIEAVLRNRAATRHLYYDEREGRLIEKR